MYYQERQTRAHIEDRYVVQHPAPDVAGREASYIFFFVLFKSLPRPIRQARREVSSFSDAHVSYSCQYFFFPFFFLRAYLGVYGRLGVRCHKLFRTHTSAPAASISIYLFIYFLFIMELTEAYAAG